MLSNLSSDVEVAQAVQRHAAGVLKVDAAVLFLVDSSGDLVSFPVGDEGTSPSKRPLSPSRAQPQVRIPVSGSVLGKVVSSGDALLARKGDQVLSWSSAESSQLRTRDVTSLLFTPVTDLAGGVQGVLALFTYDSHELSSGDKSSATFLSGFVSAVLARIRSPRPGSPKKSDLLARARQLEVSTFPS
jgi:transcriptional regulator with GAF, ATPase, and Fis domain